MAEIDVDQILYRLLRFVIRSFYQQESRAVIGVKAIKVKVKAE